jgi:transposase
MGKRKPPDAKSVALSQQGALHPHPQRVIDPLFSEGTFFDRRDLVQVKYEMLRRAHTEGQTVVHCASAFGLSRQSFYQARAAFLRAGLPGLLRGKPGPRGAHKLTEELMRFLRESHEQQPSWGSRELAARVQQRFGVKVHPRTVERALRRQQKGGR